MIIVIINKIWIIVIIKQIMIKSPAGQQPSRLQLQEFWPTGRQAQTDQGESPDEDGDEDGNEDGEDDGNDVGDNDDHDDAL